MALKINQYAAIDNQFITQLAKELDDAQDTDKAGRIVKSVI